MVGGITMGFGEALKEEVVFDRRKVTSDNRRRCSFPTWPTYRRSGSCRPRATTRGSGAAARWPTPCRRRSSSWSCSTHRRAAAPRVLVRGWSTPRRNEGTAPQRAADRRCQRRVYRVRGERHQHVLEVDRDARRGGVGALWRPDVNGPPQRRSHGQDLDAVGAAGPPPSSP